MNKKVRATLFYLIVFLIPLNLGLHFIFRWSYVSGFLVDYLVPTLYVQDILILALIILWLPTIKKENVIRSINFKFVPPLVLFIFSVLFSVISSRNFYGSLYAFLHLILYVGFFFYVLHNFDTRRDFSRVVKIFSVSVLLLSVLAFAQWKNQGSVFNNYLLFGEQPYTFSTYNVNRENLFGFTRVPAYGLFRHPNVFGGYLAVVLLWLLILVPENKFVTGAFVLGLISLFVTLSISALTVFIIGVVFLYLPRKASLIIALFLLLILFGLPFYNTTNPSLNTRATLLSNGYSLIDKYPLFGTGINTSSSLAPNPRFLQPIHNVFILIFEESGVFAFLFFIAFILITIAASIKKKLLLISLLQILLLSGFDHYFYTIHQTQILFWLVLGVIYAFDTFDTKETTKDLH